MTARVEVVPVHAECRRVVVLPNGRAVRLSAYVAAWRVVLRSPPDMEFKGWDHFATPAGRILAELRRGLHDRINRHVAGYGHGRKWSDDWQRAAAYTADHVNTPRLIVRWCPPDLRRRLAHRLEVEL